MINKITPSEITICTLNLMKKQSEFNKSLTNEKTLKYETLGTSLINSPMPPPSMLLFPILFNKSEDFLQLLPVRNR